MLVGGLPFDPSEAMRQASPAQRAASPAQQPLPAKVNEGADAAAMRGREAFDQTVRDKAVSLAKGDKPANSRDGARRSAGDPTELTPEEEQQVREFKKRDAEVRRHEQAHARAAGPYGGQPQYQYVRGPDGKQYAISGEVKIDTSAEGSPEATARKMDTIIRAALAPADPSGQDRQVANEAKQKKAEAQAELRAEKQTERSTGLKRQQQRAADPALAGLPQDVARQAASAYGRAVDLLSTARRTETAVSV